MIKRYLARTGARHQHLHADSSVWRPLDAFLQIHGIWCGHLMHDEGSQVLQQREEPDEPETGETRLFYNRLFLPRMQQLLFLQTLEAANPRQEAKSQAIKPARLPLQSLSASEMNVRASRQKQPSRLHLMKGGPMM